MSRPAESVRATFREAGVRGWLHARRVDGSSDEVAVDSDEPVPIASVHKLGLAAVWGQLVDDGALDPLARVRLSPGRRTPARVGVHATHVRRSTREAQRRIQADTGTRDFTAFMAALWRRQVAPGPGGDVVRDALRAQVWPHRLRAGFPHDDVVVATKTGTLGTLRHDVGVVEFPHEVPVAVAVLTRAARAGTHLPAVDRAIGEAAAEAVRRLRRPAPG